MRRTLLIHSLIVALLSSGSAFAQQQELFDLSLAELVNIPVYSIASSFVETDLNLASRVSRVTREQWQQQGGQRNKDPLAYLPGSAVYETIGGAAGLSVRGFSNNVSIRTNTAELLDGIPLNNFSLSGTYFKPNLDLGVLNSVEMIRGPGSILYGSDAFNAVYSMQSYEAEQDELRLRGQTGSFGQRDAILHTSQGLSASSRVDMALSYSRVGDQRIDYIADSLGNSGQRSSAYESFAGVLKGRIQLNDRHRLSAGLYRFEHLAENFSGTNISGLPLGGLTDSDSELTLIKLADLLQLNKLYSLEISAFKWWDRHQHTLGLNPGPIEDYSRSFFDEQRSGGKLLLRKLRGGSAHQLSAGLEYNKHHIVSADKALRFNTLERDSNAAYAGEKRFIRTAFFQNVYFFNDRWSTVYGARLDDYSDFGRQLSPQLAIIYKPEPTQSLKFSYGNAFRAPAAGELFGVTNVDGNAEIKPETIDTYELIFLNYRGRWKYSASGYYSLWDEKIVTQANDALSVSSNAFRYTNSGSSYSYGGEIEVEYKSPGLSAAFNASYTRSFNETSTGDEEFRAYPRTMINAWASYPLPIAPLAAAPVVAFVGLRCKLDMHNNSDASSTQELGDYYRIDSGARWQRDTLGVSLFVSNLFNSDLQLPSVWSLPEGVREPGRALTLSLDYQLH